MPLRVLVTGGTGLLGRAVLRVFDEDAKWEATGTAFSRFKEDAKPRLVKLDLTDEEEVERLVREIDPQVIVHCAAERRPDVCENDPSLTQKVNVGSVALLSRLANEIPDTFLIYVSTDYVFDGKEPPYKPNAATNPLNEYGRSKAAGEEALWASGHNGGVLRVPVLYGLSSDAKESAITVLLAEKGLQLATPKANRKEVKVDDLAVRFPTFVEDVALALKALAARRMKHCSLSGTWHFSGDEQMSKFALVQRVATLLGEDASHVLPDREPSAAGASRPHNSQLETSALKLMGVLKLTPFDSAIVRVVRHLQEHSSDLGAATA